MTLTRPSNGPLDKGVSVNRKRLREALERRAKRLHARVQERRRVRHLVEEACRGQGQQPQQRGNSQGVMIYRRARMLCSLLASIRTMVNDKMLGEHRLNAAEGADAGQVERLQRVHRALGYDGTVTIPDKLPLHVLFAAGDFLWGRGIDVQRGREKPPASLVAGGSCSRTPASGGLVSLGTGFSRTS